MGPKGARPAAQSLRNFIVILPYRIHTILTELSVILPPVRETTGNSVQFTNRKQDATTFEHRLTKIAHPWTNRQVERLNRTLKEATVKRYHYDIHGQLKTHLSDFVDAYNYARD